MLEHFQGWKNGKTAEDSCTLGERPGQGRHQVQRTPETRERKHQLGLPEEASWEQRGFTLLLACSKICYSCLPSLE